MPIRVAERARITMVQVDVCGECISAECSATNRNLLSTFVMCVSEAFSLRLLANQGNLIDTPLSFSENIHNSEKSYSSACYNESKKRLFCIDDQGSAGEIPSDQRYQL